MAVLVKHAKTSAIADIGDASLVQPSDWNANHTVTGLGSMAEANTADYAPIASPVFTGNPQAPTPPVGDEDQSIATTAFVQSTVDSSIGTIGLLGYFDYTFNGSAYTPPPIAGNLRMNNANQTLVTHVYIHEQTAPANDAALMLAQIGIGDKLLMQKKADATKWRRYTVTAVSDAGTYWDFTVTYVDGGAALDNARTAVIVQKATGVGSQPLDATLTALAGLNATAGLVEQTGTDVFTKRLIGVANATDIPTRANADARYAQLAGATMTGALVLPVATTAIPSMRVPHGAAPTSPTNGDIWTTTAGLFARINGATVGPYGTGTAAAASAVAFTPAGAIAATNVQAAIAELDSEKLALTGGSLTGSLNIDMASPINYVNGRSAGGGIGSWYFAADYVDRWAWGVGSQASGANMFFERYNDAGVWQGYAITMNRSTGVVNFEVTPTVAGTPITLLAPEPSTRMDETTALRERIDALEARIAALEAR